MLHKLPYAYYNVDEREAILRLITNIFVRISVRPFGSKQMERWSVLEDYYITDGDRPETIADKYYGKVSYWWVVLAANPQFQSMHHWPVSGYELEKFLEKQYGERRFEFVENGFSDLDQSFFNTGEQLVDWQTVSPPINDIEKKTIRELYFEQNDIKRRIKLITKEQVGEFIKQFDEAIDDYKRSKR